MKRHSLKPDYRINLIRLQQVCEKNYLRLMCLLPKLSDQEHFRLPVRHRNHLDGGVEWLVIDVLERSPFTTLLKLQMKADWGQLFSMPKAEVRLYHDVRMAEVVSRNTSQIIQPRYNYPNRKMHQPDEKEQLNLFLAHWLDYALPACRTYAEKTG
ncbi:DUF1249 domain-containing protein [Endozoicomonas sp. ONNA2]|uniref:DUF1249 domain-containing protein n=1 Tax=Endozoicomonas sp. ONNA2 TaxID=2828741 RepID=UPI0021474356|nr:DUF1249 domain-containing protein [Endozoicomonas sp. ONNA2]